jgi:DNA-binding IclR family transcriptional regulator
MAPPEACRSSATRATPAIADAIVRVENEYREMPGLSLTLSQAARLWGMDRGTCEALLEHLIERRVLKRASNGTYIRR